MTLDDRGGGGGKSKDDGWQWQQFWNEGGTIYVNKSVTKRINFFINPYYMDILCNISVCRVPRRGYIVKNGVHPPFT